MNASRVMQITRINVLYKHKHTRLHAPWCARWRACCASARNTRNTHPPIPPIRGIKIPVLAEDPQPWCASGPRLFLTHTPFCT